MPSNYSAKRIGKNTMLLYIRMVVMMAITFYTTRVLLNTLGVEDYGLYNVLMGVVTMFSFISTSMTSATQRFISYGLGENDRTKLTNVFSASIYIYIIVIFASVILFETLGLFYIRNYLNIPSDRYVAALWVYQLVVLQFVFLTVRIPYNAAIIAYERMDFYAYTSILEAVLALGLIYVLDISNCDKLIMYAFLIMLSKMLLTFMFIWYCSKHATDCCIVHYKLVPKETYGEIWSFSSWSIFGTLAVATNIQGTNLLINYFSGVAVNASVGVSTQLTSGLHNVVTNLQTAFNPQLVKTYAAGEYSTFYSLLFRNCKFCYYLFFFITLPLILVSEEVLHIWLGEDCIYAVEFCICMLIFLAIESLAYPLTIAIQAVGKIRLYQKLSGAVFLLLLPIAYILYLFDLSPVWIFVCRIFQNIVILVLRMIYMSKISTFSILQFTKSVITPVLTVTALSIPLPYIISVNICGEITKILIVTLISVICVGVAIYTAGITSTEKMTIKKLALKVLKQN